MTDYPDASKAQQDVLERAMAQFKPKEPKSDAEIRMDMAKLGYVVQMDGTITKPNGDPLTERTWVHPDHWVISLRRLERAKKWK